MTFRCSRVSSNGFVVRVRGRFCAVMSAHGLLNSVFSCSPSASKTRAKKKVRQTRSLDSALMGSCGGSGDHQRSRCSTGGQTSPESPKPTPRVSTSSLSASSDASFSLSIHHDCKSGKRNASRDASLNLAGSSSIFSPRKWLQRKLPHSEISSHNNKSEVRLQKCDGLKLELLLLTRSRCAHQYEFVEGTSQMISEVLGLQMLRNANLLFMHACRKGEVNEKLILK